jgi:hypothetical protein
VLGQWHIAPNENIEREARHGWCEAGGGGAKTRMPGA